MTGRPLDPRLEALFRKAAAAFQSRDLAAAKALADEVLAGDPSHYEAANLGVMACFQAGNAGEALTRIDRVIALFPGDAVLYNTRGAVLQTLARVDDAARSFEQATALLPGYAEAWANLGMLHFRSGSYRDAAAALAAAERAGLRSVKIAMSLGSALFQTGDAPGAEAAWRRAQQLEPRSAPILANLSTALLQLGRPDEARECAQRAVAIEPALVAARDNLAEALLLCARASESEAITVETVAMAQGTARTFLCQALGRLQLLRFDAAVAPAREAARLDPTSPRIAGVEAMSALQAGDLERALGCVDRAIALDSNAAPWRFLRALAWPALLPSRERIASRHREVARDLDALVAAPGALMDPFDEVGMTGFYMAYQGFDDTQLLGKIAQAYRGACPSLEWTAPHIAAKHAGARIRIGIASAFLCNHTIGKLNIGFAQHLDRERFEVFIIRPQAPGDTLSEFFDRAAAAVITLPRNLVLARERIAQAQLDAIFYPDVGMDAFMYLLAFARLARCQFTTWGHPATTGIPNMDHFISSDLVETADADCRYHEHLVRFASLPSFYHRPRSASAFDVRRQLGLAASERVYACAQTIFKMHPDLDDALVKLLRQDPHGHVVLIESAHASWNAILRARLERAGPDVASRIHAIPGMPLPDYLALLRDADALLDTFHFGGGNSSYEALSAGAPVVTLPGVAMRSCITAGWYRAMGNERWIARSSDDYVRLALELAHDRGHRAEWRAEVAGGAAAILENTAVVREMERFVEQALEPTL